VTTIIGANLLWDISGIGCEKFSRLGHKKIHRKCQSNSEIFSRISKSKILLAAE